MSPAVLDRLLEDLAAVSCDCDHKDHELDVIRFRNTDRVWGYRLSPCVAAGCTCRGGRA